MEMIYFTIAAIVLYVISDKIVNLIERKRGDLLPNRSILFFAIILTLSVITFNLIQHFNQSVEPKDVKVPAPTSTQTRETK